MADKTRKNDKSPKWSEKPCVKSLEIQQHLVFVNTLLKAAGRAIIKHRSYHARVKFDVSKIKLNSEAQGIVRRLHR